MKERKLHTVHLKFVQLVALAKKMDASPRTWGTDEPLSGAEITMIETIGDYGETKSVTELAHALEITKGAVSQTLKKLEQKKLTAKVTDPENRARLIATLTREGKAAYDAHKEWHKNMDGGWRAYFHDLDEEKVDFLLEFLLRTEDFFKRAITEKHDTTE